MNFNWMKPQEVLDSDYALVAEARLMAIKKAGKILKKSVEESLRTSKSSVKNEDLEIKKKRASEHILGDNLAYASVALNESKNIHSCSSPFQTILEHYANLEKTMAHMMAANDLEVENLLQGDTPLVKLLMDDIPNYNASKKELEHLVKKMMNSHNALEKETKKLEKLEMIQESELIVEGNSDALLCQREKKERLQHEYENLEKDVSIEVAKVTSTLLSLTSRENRYAITIVDLMRRKKKFFENAFRTIEAELPNVERLLLETCSRPVFGEKLEDHLRATDRIIALPIHLAVFNLLRYGMKEEGLFRISPKQIKLDKYKAHLDANIDIDPEGEDSHLQAALLKSYLRELPEPLLLSVDKPIVSNDIVNQWLETATLNNKEKKLRNIKSILGDLTKQAYDNVQYLLKFLHVLVDHSAETKMTSSNLAIVLGPNLMCRDSKLDQSKLDNVMSIVVTLIDSYPSIFDVDIDLNQYNHYLEFDKSNECSSSSSSSLVALVNKANSNIKGNSSGGNGQESPGLSIKRRQSFRTFRKNIMAKLTPPSIAPPPLPYSAIQKSSIEREYNSV